MAGEQNPKLPKPIPRPPGGRATAVLVPQGALAGQPDVPLDRPVTTFGSNDSARLHLVSRTISKGHGIFVNSGGVTYVADMASRTGVLVNGKLIHDADLKTGDRVQIGKFLFRYRAAANQTPPPPAVMPPAASVIVVGSPPRAIEGRVFQIGRRDNSDVSFANDAAVSAGHAVIFEMDGRWHLRDLGSRTGTTVNGKSIHQCALNFGDRIQIGSSTILFQPGVVPVDEIEEPATEPDLEDSTAAAVPLDFDEEPAAPVPVADGDAIPLADELPLKGMDWKSAFPKLDPEPEVSPVVPVGTGLSEALPVAEPATDFAELERVAEENLAQSEQPAAASAVTEEAEPVAEAPAADFGELDSTELIEVSRAEPLGSVLAQVSEAALPVEDVAVVEVPLEGTEPLPLTEKQVEASALTGVADDIAEALALLGEAEEASPIEDHADVEKAPVELPAEQATEPVAIAAEKPAFEIPVEEPAPSASSPVTVEPAELVTPVDDFVFVPADEKADAVPEVIFWGDTDLDTVAEQTVAKPSTVSPVVDVTPVRAPTSPVEIEQPLVDEVEEAVAEQLAEITAESNPKPIAEPVTVSHVEEIPIDANADVAAHFVATMPTAEAEKIVISEPVASAEVSETTVPPPEIAVDAVALSVESVKISAPETVACDLAESVIQPIHVPSADLSEIVAEPLREAVAESATTASNADLGFVDECEAEDEISLLDEAWGEAGSESAEPLDPLSDSFPLVAALEDVMVPQDLTAIASAPAADAEVSGSHTVDAVPTAEDFTLTEEPDGHDADLDFLDFTETPTEPATEVPPPAAEVAPAPPVTPEKAAESAGTGKGPSIFGFDFGEGSFLGGMPISLVGPVAPAVPSVGAAPASPVFDARANTPSGLGQMLTAPPVVPVAPQPDRPTTRPMTPPRPAGRQPNAPAGPASLTGLVSDAHLPWATPPVIPPTSRDPATGPNTGPKPGAGPRRALTSNFTMAPTPPRVTEVFSQMSAPIGVEVFGGPPGDPNQFEVPDSKETAAEQAAQAGPTPAPAKVIELPPMKSRWPRLPFLLLMMVLIPAILAASIYKFVPVSSAVMGSLAFDGVISQQMTDGADTHVFFASQATSIGSPEVQQLAMEILEKQGQPYGFTGDYDTYQGIVTSQSLNPSGNTLQFTYNTTDATLGKAQVKAVMMALAQKDRDLDEIKNRAQTAAEAAKAAVDASTANLKDIIKQRREMLDKAQDHPDAAIVADADREAARLNQLYLDAQKVRISTETALADLRSQDPTKPIDIEADPHVVDLKKQLQPLLDQIATLKGTSSVNAGSPKLVGTKVPLGATTQPDDSNPLLAPLQQQADLLNKKLDARRADLAAEAAIGIDQRQVNQQKAIENLSVKITDLQKAEADAKTAADQATTKVNGYHTVVNAATLAGLQAQDLTTKQDEAKAEQDRARTESEDKEAALAKCITVYASTDPKDQNPTAAVISATDMRPKLAIGSTFGAWIFLLALIAGELRRPKLMTSLPPAAAPRINATSKLVPWPQPEEFNGVEHGQGNEPPVVGESEQVFGV